MKKLALALIGGLGVLSPSAQRPEIELTKFYEDDASVEGYPEGYSTWRVWLRMPQSEDFVSCLYATEDSPPIYIFTDGNDIWNHSFGGVVASDVNDAQFEAFPALRYDSWVTIGQTEMNSTGDVFASALSPTNESFELPLGNTTPSNSDTGFYVTHGIWFNDFADADGYAGGDHRVLVAQITSSTLPIVSLNVAYYRGGDAQFLEKHEGLKVNRVTTNIESQDKTKPGVWPNPMKDRTNVSMCGAACIEIYNLQGKRIRTLDLFRGRGEILREGLPTGIYLLQFRDSIGTTLYTERLVVVD